jgi:hypothetical protein
MADALDEVVLARLRAMQGEFRNIDDFVSQLVSASFDRRKKESDQTPTRAKRLAFLQKLASHQTNPRDFDFDSLRENRADIEQALKEQHRANGTRSKFRSPKTLFDLLAMLAQGKLHDAKNTPREFPDWLLRGLKKLRVADEEPVESEEIDPGPQTASSESPRASNRSKRSKQSRSSKKSKKSKESGRRTTKQTQRRLEQEVEDEEQTEQDVQQNEDVKEDQDDEEKEEEEEEYELEGARATQQSTRQSWDQPTSPQMDLGEIFDRLNNDEEEEEEEGEDDGDGWDRMSVGGRDDGVRPRKKSPKQSTKQRRVSVGGRVFQLQPEERVSLHFATPGEASMETLLKFIKLVQPDSKMETLEQLEVSPLRDYAYELWLAQTDDQLFALADQFSGNTGVIHPVIQQELDDTVRKYTQQLEDVNENGRRAIQKLKARASALPKDQQALFDKCVTEVERALDPSQAGKEVPCTEINNADQPTESQLRAMARKPSKWLIRDPTTSQTKMFAKMSAAEIQQFANYLVGQSAIGNCRMSQFLETLAGQLESHVQKAKDSGAVPEIDKIETLRFVEWLMRRPVDVKNATSVPLWLLRYPYVQGQHKLGNLPLSAKYLNFKASTPNEKLLSAVFEQTNAGNIEIMKMGYDKNFSEPKLF